MRIAWFRPDVARTGFDDLGAVVAALREAHQIHMVPERAAHDFVWQWARGQFDLCVYELEDTRAHQYVWPYTLHYPGVLALRAARLHESRSLALIHQHRDADSAAEAAFADGPGGLGAPWTLIRGAAALWKIPVLASRLTVVADAALGGAIAEQCPQARVTRPPVGVPDPGPAVAAREPHSPVRVLVCEEGTPGSIERAAERARRAGAAIEIRRGRDAGEIATADVVIATRWPADGRPPMAALLAAAAGRTLIVAESETVAEWPALDPQTWQSRVVPPAPTAAPMAISIDPRDEEHSLMRALMRVATDADLRTALGSAAREWWSAHATIPRAVAAWERLLADACRLAPPPRPADWPSHLDADGSALAHEILRQFGVAPTDIRVPW